VGPFFPEWEFSTLFGLERAEVRAIADAWPVIADREKTEVAINNALNNLSDILTAARASGRNGSPLHGQSC
jgi:hypothetical protein